MVTVCMISPFQSEFYEWLGAFDRLIGFHIHNAKSTPNTKPKRDERIPFPYFSTVCFSALVRTAEYVLEAAVFFSIFRKFTVFYKLLISTC